MPYRKRKPKRRRRRKSNLSIQPFNKSPMPMKFPTKLRYVESFTIDPAAAGLAAVHVFNAAGLYDPNTTATGHQPRGFDQLMAMYDHYVCVGSKMKLQISNDSTESSNQICGVALRDSSTTSSDPNDYQEGGTVRSTLLSSAGGSHDTVSLALGYSPKKFLGISKPLSASELKGTVASNPAESAYYHVFAAGLVGTNPTTVTCTVTIDYLTVFVEPKVVAQS